MRAGGWRSASSAADAAIMSAPRRQLRHDAMPLFSMLPRRVFCPPAVCPAAIAVDARLFSLPDVVQQMMMLPASGAAQLCFSSLIFSRHFQRSAASRFLLHAFRLRFFFAAADSRRFLRPAFLLRIARRLIFFDIRLPRLSDFSADFGLCLTRLTSGMPVIFAGFARRAPRGSALRHFFAAF